MGNISLDSRCDSPSNGRRYDQLDRGLANDYRLFHVHFPHDERLQVEKVDRYYDFHVGLIGDDGGAYILGESVVVVRRWH